MPDCASYELEYRPSTYWDTPTALLANIKGARRKSAAREFLEKGDFEGLEDWMTQEGLPAELRDALGRIHPALMGGEHLPDFYDDEVEIARVTLRSVMADVISVRARRVAVRIVYRIVDEYGTTFDLFPEDSERPLSMEELIGLMDGALDEDHHEIGITERYRELNCYEPGDAEGLVDFVTVTSEFYPELTAWYAEEAEEWVREKKAEIDSAA